MDEVSARYPEEVGEHAHPPLAERILVWLAVAGLFAMAAIITINAVGRWVGHTLIPDDILLIEELMVPVLLFPIGVVTAFREHITVEIFTRKFSARGKLYLGLLSHVVGLVFGLIVCAAAIQAFLRTWETQDYYQGVLHMPMWIGHLLFVAALILFVFRLAFLLFADTNRVINPKN